MYLTLAVSSHRMSMIKFRSDAPISDHRTKNGLKI